MKGSDVMAKQKEGFNIQILIFLALGVIIILALKGYFGGTNTLKETIINNNTLIEKLEQAPINPLECELSFSKSNAYIDEPVILRITDGKNTICHVYYNYESTGWRYLISITTNSYGVFEVSRAAEIAGEYRFAAICGQCITNYEDILIKPLPDADDGSDGTDDDGDGSPLTACTSPWPKPTSQASCDDRGACPPGQYCKFRPETSFMTASCACVTPATDCSSSCLEQGMGSTGHCTYQIIKYPCGTSTPNSVGNKYCTASGIGSCCCP
jgi:hypothetical protein